MRTILDLTTNIQTADYIKNLYFGERGFCMNIEGKHYEPPRIWPGLLEMNDQISRVEGYPFQYLIRSGGSLLGLIFGLDRVGVMQITKLLETNKDLHCKLIIGIYPACASSHQELEKMLVIQNEFPNQVDFRLYVINSTNGGTSSSLLFIDESNEDPIMATGPMLGFNSLPIDPCLASYVFHPESALLKDWIGWFDCIWVKHAILLNSFTARIPVLVPREASEEVLNVWGDYLQRCLKSRDYAGENVKIVVEINRETGEMVARNQFGQEVPLPSKELGISQISPLKERISRLYSAGKLVSFNKLTRIPPLDCPARAEWFGEESLKKVGTVTKEIKYRISALDTNELKKFNNLKKNGTDLLRRLGFTLGDGLHWMTDAIIILLQKELERITAEALQVIYESMGVKVKDVDTQVAFHLLNVEEENNKEVEQRREITKVFIAKQLKRIVSDSNRIYKEFSPGAELDQTTIDDITMELETRLEKVLTGNVIPSIIRNKISFSTSISEDQTVPFDQSLLLLENLALFSRMILSEDRFYLQGVKIDAKVLLNAIDVCGDQIILASRHGNVRNRAILERIQLEEVMQSKSNSEDKCKAIFAIIDGTPWNEIREIIKIPIMED